jgi:hypothetical protein
MMNGVFLRVFVLLIGILLGYSHLQAEVKSDLKPIAFYNINEDFKSFKEKELIAGDVNHTSLKFIDMNNDNLLDIVKIIEDKENFSISVQINNGTGFNVDKLLIKNKETRDTTALWQTDIIDMNNDSLPDIVQTSTGNSGHHVVVRLNSKSGFETPKEWFANSDKRLKYFKITFIDMNNDGLLDMLQVYRYKCGHRIYVRRNTGHNFSEKEEWLNDSDFRYLSDTWTMDIVDINADGLPDIVNKSIGEEGHQVYVRLNNGSKLEDEKLWYSKSRSDLQYWDILFIDINGDRLLDMVQKYEHSAGHMLYVAYNMGDTFKKAEALLYDLDERYKSKAWTMDLVDINGDGFVDVVNSSIDRSGYKVYRRINHGKELGQEKFWFSDMRSDLENWKIKFLDLTHSKLKDIIQNSVKTPNLEVSSF